jgi:DNA (cytosine-5)-methyltransferase 1
MAAYYNEHDPHAAQWLRNLIAAGHIAPGEVDERDIRDVAPDELAGFAQCHFFAGIGVWSYALRQAGWPDDRPIWTGSCPCQSFSAAGGGKGFADERHLWPAWFHLIGERRPTTIFGEQVGDAVRHGWLDLVQSDLEGIGYACGAVNFPSAGVGAPHIRQRLWFVASAVEHPAGLRCDIWPRGAPARGRKLREFVAMPAGEDGIVANADGGLSRDRELQRGRELRFQPEDSGACRLAESGERERRRGPPNGASLSDGQDTGRRQGLCDVERGGEVRELGYASSDKQWRNGEPGSGARRKIQAGRSSLPGELEHAAGDGRDEGRTASSERGSIGGCGAGELENPASERRKGRAVSWNDIKKSGSGLLLGGSSGDALRPGPVNGFWRDADWIFCTDNRWRPIGASLQPLVNGSAFRLGSGSPYEGKSRAKMLRGYGNAINAEAARAFIEAFLSRKETE